MIHLLHKYKTVVSREILHPAIPEKRRKTKGKKKEKNQIFDTRGNGLPAHPPPLKTTPLQLFFSWQSPASGRWSFERGSTLLIGQEYRFSIVDGSPAAYSWGDIVFFFTVVGIAKVKLLKWNKAHQRRSSISHASLGDWLNERMKEDFQSLSTKTLQWWECHDYRSNHVSTCWELGFWFPVSIQRELVIGYLP